MIKFILGMFAIIFSVVGGTVDNDIVSLMSFMIVVMCFGFSGIIEAIQKGGSKT